VVVPQDADSDPRKYVQLAARLRRDIRNGTLCPGVPVPSITALVAEHGGWARQTCSKALQLLEDEGLLFRVAGLGYYVVVAHLNSAGPDPSTSTNSERAAGQPS
jgi:DNA-binding GntR family transcriptional regulator